MSAWAARKLRTRLAVAYVIATSLVLCVFAIIVAVFVHERLHAEIAHRLDQEVEIAERSLRMDGAGRLVWYAPHGAHEPYLPLRNVSWLDIHRPDGTLIYRVPESDMAGTVAAIPSFEKEHTSGIFSITTPGGVQYRVLQRDIEITGQRAISRAAISEDQAERQLDILYRVIGLGLPLAMLLSGFGDYQMAGRALAPMSRISVTGDSGLLHQVIVNILDNAIKYTPPGGRVLLRVDHTDSEAILEIADDGPGIAAENHKKVFERFYRVDVSRSRTVEGFGLGLTITRRVVEIHGGRIEVPSTCQTGSVYHVVLPLVMS
jgi:hypothetical protein